MLAREDAEGNGERSGLCLAVLPLYWLHVGVDLHAWAAMASLQERGQCRFDVYGRPATLATQHNNLLTGGGGWGPCCMSPASSHIYHVTCAFLLGIYNFMRHQLAWYVSCTASDAVRLQACTRAGNLPVLHPTPTDDASCDACLEVISRC